MLVCDFGMDDFFFNYMILHQKKGRCTFQGLLNEPENEFKSLLYDELYSGC